MTLLEEKEYQMIKDGLVFDSARGRYIASYPWIVDANKVPFNREFACALLKSTEKRMNRNQLHAEIYKNRS